MGLGDLPGGIFGSADAHVSADGSVVVGYSNSASGLEAFCWTPETGMVGLGFGMANSVSADGSVIVGYRHNKSGADAVRTARSGRIIELEKLPEDRDCEARDVSADGSVIVGSSTTADGEQAFYWTPSEGTIQLDHLPGRRNGAAYGISADGSVIVGSSWSTDGLEASRWTRDGKVVGLGTLPSKASSEAYGVSADGSVVVGRSGTSEAFRWTEKEGMVGLGMLPGGHHNSVAMGVSADGSVVVGQSSSKSGMQAFIWDATHGMRSVQEVLVNRSVPGEYLAGWKLTSANAVSTDGRVIVGTGFNPYGDREAWIAIRPSSPAATPRGALADRRTH
jgi:probable HAF family extracellular repeat protein